MCSLQLSARKMWKTLIFAAVVIPDSKPAHLRYSFLPMLNSPSVMSSCEVRAGSDSDSSSVAALGTGIAHVGTPGEGLLFDKVLFH